tara:strand:+ start:366 stop:512 length:147 start_codon:yes stop_codon:yes gene_type:complete
VVQAVQALQLQFQEHQQDLLEVVEVVQEFVVVFQMVLNFQMVDLPLQE